MCFKHFTSRTSFAILIREMNQGFYVITGVATFCRPNFTPSKSEEGLTGSLPSSKFEDSIGFYDGIEEEFSQEDLKALDSEGRCVMTCHQIEVNISTKNLLGNSFI